METKEKKLSFFELLMIGIGQIIGSGIVVLLCIAIGMTGKGVAMSYLFATIIIIIPLIPLAALGSAIPNKGGMYSYVRDLIGHKTAFFYVALLVFGQFILAQYAIGISQYAAELWPFINQRVLAGLVMTFVFVVNLVGLKTSVLVQRITVIILLGSLFAFVAFGLPQVHDVSSFFEFKNIMPNGLLTFISAMLLIRYTMIGGEFISEFGGKAKNPGRDIPAAMIVSTLVVALIYFLISIVAAGVLPIDAVANKTLGVVAKEILPKYMYYIFMIGGGMAALFTSLNAVFSWAPTGIKAAINDGWLPKKFAEENKKFGTPHWLLLMYYLIGMYPIIIGQEIKVVSLIGANVGLIFSIFPVITLIFLKKKKPLEYAKAKFKLGPVASVIFPVLSVCIYLIGIGSSWNFLKSEGAIMPIVVFCIIVFIYTLLREGHVKKVMENGSENDEK